MTGHHHQSGLVFDDQPATTPAATCDCGWSTTHTRRHRVDEKLANHRCKGHRRSCRTCGWSVTADSAKRADYAKRQHSCARHLARQESAERALQREAAVDRTPKPCLHKEAQHEHGTYACYVLDTCRCRPCSDANRVYEADRTRQQAYGRWNGLIDAEPARQHVRRLMAAGMGLKQIGKAANASGGVMNKLIYGHPHHDGTRRPPARRIRPTTAERLLSVQLQLADGAKIPGTATARRIQALVALGWSGSKLADRLGIDRGNLTPMLHGRRDVTVATAKAVHQLYRDLADTRPPETNQRERISASRARNMATTNGWPPPLRIGGRLWIGDPLDGALDHDEIEPTDIAPQLDEAAILRRLNGDRTVRLRKGEAAELVRRWVATGRSLNECERITGVKPDRYFTLRDTTTPAAS